MNVSLSEYRTVARKYDRIIAIRMMQVVHSNPTLGAKAFSAIAVRDANEQRKSMYKQLMMTVA